MQMLSRLLICLCLLALASLQSPAWSDPPAAFAPASEAGQEQFMPRPAVHEPRRANLRLTSVLATGGPAYPGTLFTVFRDQPGTFGKSRATVMAQAGPKAFAEFDLTADRYRVQARNGAVVVEQTVTVPAQGGTDAEVVLDAGELHLVASMDAEGTPAGQAWFRVLRPDTDSYGRAAQVQVASDGYADSGTFVLPAGGYVAEARYGDAVVQQAVAIRAGEQRSLELVLNAGRLDLVTTLASGADPMAGASVTLLQRTADPDAPLREAASAEAADGVSFILPQGDYVARARLDRASAELPVSIVAGATRTVELPLQAGELQVYATLAGRDDALLDSWFDVGAGGDDGPDTTAAMRGPDNLVRFVVPAGTHRVSARHGESSGHVEVEVEPGSQQTLAVDLDAGRVSVSLTRKDATAAEPYTWFSVYRIERDASGSERRHRVYNDGYYANTDIVLPTGDYIARARTDQLRGEQRFVVEPGRVTRVDISATR